MAARAAANGTDAKPVQPVISPAGQLIYPSQMPRRRRTTPILVLLLASLALRVLLVPISLHSELAQYQRLSGGPSAAPPATQWAEIVTQIGGYLNTGLCVALVVVLMVSVYRVHRDLMILTCGVHRPRPGLALGLLFIPVFHWIWLWHLLRKLSGRTSVDPPGRTWPNGAWGAPIGVGWAHAYLVAMCALLAATAVYIVVLVSTIVRTFPYGGLPEWFPEFLVAGSIMTAVLGLVADVCLVIALRGIGRAVGDYTESHMAAARSMPPGVAAVVGKMPISMPLTAAPPYAEPAKECDA